MKKNTILIVILSLVLAFFIIFGLVKFFSYEEKANIITGVENYNKKYYISKYKGDLDSNLSIFPYDKTYLTDATFISSFSFNLFDVSGYIILDAKYNEEVFNKEIDRLKNISITVKETCYASSKKFTNYILYNEESYEYPAYIAIDGFANKYEYALVYENNLEIIYVYLAYPNINNQAYNKYLKKDKKEYAFINTLNLYSIYNHTFNNGASFAEFDDC